MSAFTSRAQDVRAGQCIIGNDEVFEPKLKGQVYIGLARMVGTEFYNPAYLKGDIYLENGEIAVNQNIKYNGRIDGLLLLPPNSSKEILLDKYFIKGFCFKDFMGSLRINFNKILVAKELSKDSIQIFGQVLYHNKLSLYAYRRYVYDQDILEYADGKQIARQFFGPSFVYYFQLPGNKTIGFKSFKRRDLYKLFPENAEMMKKIFKMKHQRRFRSEDDLIRITEILNLLYKD